MNKWFTFYITINLICPPELMNNFATEFTPKTP